MEGANFRAGGLSSSSIETIKTVPNVFNQSEAGGKTEGKVGAKNDPPKPALT